LTFKRQKTEIDTFCYRLNYNFCPKHYSQRQIFSNRNIIQTLEVCLTQSLKSITKYFTSCSQIMKYIEAYPFASIKK